LAISAFSNLSITLSDGLTVPSTNYLGTKTYVDIGSGNILKISWNTPTATNNSVDNYIVKILKYDNASASYKQLHSINVGNVNEFYVKSTLFSSIAQAFMQLRIYVEVVSKYGNVYNGTSNTVQLYVSKGCGVYTKVTKGYKQPIMKRTIAFTKLANKTLTASDGTPIVGTTGETLYAKAANAQDNVTGWSLMQEFYAKDANNNWQMNDIKYEVLTDINGEVITDSADSWVYTL
jgi:hypothetical protein